MVAIDKKQNPKKDKDDSANSINHSKKCVVDKFTEKCRDENYRYKGKSERNEQHENA